MTALKGLVSIAKVQKRLRDRADSFGRDASLLRSAGGYEDSPRDVAMLEGIARELRQVADSLGES